MYLKKVAIHVDQFPTQQIKLTIEYYSQPYHAGCCEGKKTIF